MNIIKPILSIVLNVIKLEPVRLAFHELIKATVFGLLKILKISPRNKIDDKYIEKFIKLFL